MFDKPAVAAIDVRGGGPGTREGALLELSSTVQRIDAIALAGGSAFGLEAGGGVQAWLTEQGRGSHPRSSNSDRPAPSCSTCATAATRPGAGSHPNLGYTAAVAAAKSSPIISA